MLSRFKQICSTMTYRDMVDLSTILAENLPPNAKPQDVADVLLDLPDDTDDDQMDNTNRVLQSCFNRKKIITIQPEKHSAGGMIFKIACPSVEGAIVFDSNVREGVSQLLDTLTVLQAFSDG
jgi:hypothetical protein